MKRYFAYIRVATVRQGERGSSLQEQKSAIEAYARRLNLSIAEWFEEMETAAKQGRPVFTKMLAALERGVASGVVTHKIDRSARNLRDWAKLGELVDRGIELHFAHESLDLTSRGGRLAADIQAVVAADYVRNLRDELRKGFYGRLKQGLYPLRAPIGYLDQGRAKPKTIDPVRGPIIAKAFELYGSGQWSFDRLGEELFNMGLRRRVGGRVTRNGLSTIFNNPFYMGLIRIEKTGELFEGIHSPLIDKRLFDRVQGVLRGRLTHKANTHRFRYQRMLHCGSCGYALTAERQKGHVYYRCHKNCFPITCLREETIDAGLRELALRFRLSDTESAAIRADIEMGLAHRKETATKELQALTLAATAIDDRLARLTDAYVEHLVDRSVYVSRREQLLQERMMITSKQADLQAGDGAAQRRVENIFELLKTLGNLPDLLNDDEIRAVLKKTTSNSKGYQKSFVIDWANPFRQLARCDSVTSCGPYRTKLRTRAQSLKNFVKYFSSQEFLTSAELVPADSATSVPAKKENAGQENIVEFNRRRTRVQDGGMHGGGTTLP